MTSFGDILSVLKDYRNSLAQQTQEEVARTFGEGGEGMSAFAARGGVSAFSTPLTNVHATGVGVRVREGRIVPDEFVLKAYVFDKVPMGDRTPSLTPRYKDIAFGVETLPAADVEPPPFHLALARPRKAPRAAVAATPPQRQRRRPIVGGLSIAPLN